MCNSSDWIHCNKNPTLHRHPQITISHGVALPSWQKKNLIIISSYSWKTRKKKTKVSSPPPAPSFGSPGLPSMYLKRGTRKRLLTQKKKKKIPPFPPPPCPFSPPPHFFFQVETFACWCQAANTAP